MRFVYRLLLLLNKALTPRVLSLLAGGQELKLIIDDLGLKNNYSVLNFVNQTTTMYNLALERTAKTNPSVRFVHVSPGWVHADFVEKFLNSVSRLNQPSTLS